MQTQNDQPQEKKVRWDEITELTRRGIECKRWLNFEGLLRVREEISRLLQEDGASARDLASSWCSLAAVKLRLKHYAEAERYARKSVSYYEEHDGSNREVLATYLNLLGRILAHQRKFEEAVVYGERAVKEYSVFHGPEGSYVIARKTDVEEYRQRLYPEPYEL